MRNARDKGPHSGAFRRENQPQIDLYQLADLEN